MSRYKSKQSVFDRTSNKVVPVLCLDISTATVTYFDELTQTEERKTYHTDFIRYHLNYVSEKHPDRLRRLVNEGTIIAYLDDLEQRVSATIDRQVELWKHTDEEYLNAVTSGDVKKQIGLKNCFVGMAREIVFECMVYV